MKAKIIFFVLLFSTGGLVSFISSTNGGSKCNGEAEYASGLGVLGAYKLIKDYRLNLKGGDPAPAESFMISLKAGLKYRFMPIQNPDNKKSMILSIYLNQQKGMMLATSFNKATSKHYPTVDFACKTTGNFYMFFEIEGGEKGCGVGLFAVAD